MELKRRLSSKLQATSNLNIMLRFELTSVSISLCVAMICSTDLSKCLITCRYLKLFSAVLIFWNPFVW